MLLLLLMVFREEDCCCCCCFVSSVTPGHIFLSPQHRLIHPRGEDLSAPGGIFTKCGHKKLPARIILAGSFFICIVKRNTFGLERQVVFSVARSEIGSGRRSRWRNGSTRSHWSTCADTFNFPCTDTVEPAVLPLAGVNVK